MSWIELSHSFYASFFPEALQANEYQSDPGTAVSERYGRSSRYALLEQPHGTQEIPQAAPSGPEGSPLSSLSTSLEGHASSSEEFFYSPSSNFSLSSPSTSPSTPKPEQTESLSFIPEEHRGLWATHCISYFNERVNEIDPQGKIGKIPENEILEALRIDSTPKDIKDISEALWLRPWPSYEEADRNSIYSRIWDLLEKHKRPEI